MKRGRLMVACVECDGFRSPGDEVVGDVRRKGHSSVGAGASVRELGCGGII